MKARRRPVFQPAKPISCLDCPARQENVFRLLHADATSRVSEHKFTRRYYEGEYLFLQGDPASGVHCIQKGRVKLLYQAPGGHTHILDIAGPGHVLGLETVFAEERYPVSAEVMEESLICHLPAGLVQRLARQVPEFLLEVTRTLARALYHQVLHTADLATRSALQRFSRVLLECAERYGEPSEDGIQVDAQLTRRDLAELAGTAPETVTRLLRQLKATGALSTQRDRIIIHDLQRLREIYLNGLQ